MEGHIIDSVVRSFVSRMKAYEVAAELYLASNSPAILRLDGHGFSTFTAPLNRPFDEMIHTAMVRTCADLLRAWPAASLDYTQSDEITLVFSSGVRIFNDRVMEISTLAAGLC
ncbi:tRNAHis guanylyltransferase catalytic domain-containing protein [Xylariales sp. PMI_506]|nr:tRNAHis guanylyltransferase catalytic domain-containing protein [Xylariales sp. PMI_506]